MLPPSVMLTTKNSAPGLLSTWILAGILVLFCGCQPSGPKSLLLGEKYIQQRDYQKALRYLQRSSELMPEHPQVWNHLGLAYHGMNQVQKAAESYQRALRIDRNFAPAHFNFGVLLLEQQRLHEAIAALTAYTSLETENPEGWARLGTAYLRARRWDDAERALSQAARLNPKNPDIHNNLGMVHVQRKRAREAMQSFETALQQRPGYPPALLNQAIVAQQFFANPKLAVERYRAYLTVRPNAEARTEIERAIEQLELELNPPQVATVTETNVTSGSASNALSTNLPPAVLASRIVSNTIAALQSTGSTPSVSSRTNLVAAAQTNAAPQTNLARTVVTNLPATPATSSSSNAVASAAPGEREPEPVEPVQVVEVSDEPEFRIPSDVTASPSSGATRDTQLAMNNSARVTPGEDKPLIPPRSERQDDDKTGFIDRLNLDKANPMRWFKRDEPRNAPVPSVRSPAAIDREARLRENAASATPAQPEAPARAIARYPYRKDLSLPQGNRAQAEKLFSEAATAHAQGRLAAAVEGYRRAVNADPSYFEAHYNMSLAAYQNKDLPLALAANEQAVKARPGSQDARYNFALVLREAHYYLDAAQELKQLLSEAPNSARAHLALANIYAQQLNDPILARDHYKRVLELAPTHPEAAAIRQWLAVNP